MKDGTNGNGGIIDSIDTSSPRLSVSGKELSFYLSENATLEEETTYYVLMDLGVVLGLQTCKGSNVPFLGIYDKTFWKFTTGK